MLIGILIALALVSQAPGGVRSYGVHLDPNPTRARCRSLDSSDLRNTAYPFRAAVYPGQRFVQFKDGRYEDRWDATGGKIEWTMEIEKLESIRLAGEPATLLKFFANHIGGTGSFSHVLVVRCREQRLQIAFEAGGEGVDASPLGNNEIQITRLVAPLSQGVALYRWNSIRGRFEQVQATGK
jgi:hypothetical protein